MSVAQELQLAAERRAHDRERIRRIVIHGIGQQAQRLLENEADEERQRSASGSSYTREVGRVAGS